MSNYTPHTAHSYYRPGTSGLAVASLVLGLLGVSVLAVIFGGCALPDINAGRRTGKGMAVAGLVLGIVGCLAWFLVLGAAVSGPRVSP